MCRGRAPLWGPFSSVIKQTCWVRPCWGWTLTPQPMGWGSARGQKPVVEGRTEIILPRRQHHRRGIGGGRNSSSRCFVNSLWRINGSGCYRSKWCLSVSCLGDFTLGRIRHICVLEVPFQEKKTPVTVQWTFFGNIQMCDRLKFVTNSCSSSTD